MAKKDYTRFSKQQEYKPASKKVEETNDAVEIKEVTEPVVIEESTEVKEEPKTSFGVVTNCLRLNVRKSPSATAEIEYVIEALTEVSIDLKESTKDFYKVCTSAGVEGFCMKKFIAIKQ